MVWALKTGVAGARVEAQMYMMVQLAGKYELLQTKLTPLPRIILEIC